MNTGEGVHAIRPVFSLRLISAPMHTRYKKFGSLDGKKNFASLAVVLNFAIFDNGWRQIRLRNIRHATFLG